MPTSTVLYLGGLRTECTHLKSGQKIITDAPTDNHGKGEAFSPTDLAATSLGTCMLTVMGIVAQRHGIDMEGARAEVTKIMAEGPRRIGEIQVIITMPPKGYTDEQKQLLEATAHACPVGKSLSADLKEVVEFTWE
ncbi:MAG: OsmC family protein [bacterium]|nr:OsmC family protein [bacterium]